MTHTSQRIAALLAVALVLQTDRADAAASSWEETDGGRVRIVTEPVLPDGQTVRGVLQIDLKDGWKTYWREPGSAGIPPSISIAGDAVTDVTIHFPAPVWVDDPYGAWAGYIEPVALPLKLSLGSDGIPERITAEVFLGICKDVCIPVAASFELDLADRSSEALHSIAVSAAHAALPAPNGPRLSVDSARWTPDGQLEVAVRHAALNSEQPTLFVSAGPEHPFARPRLVSSNAEQSVFTILPNFQPADDLTLTITARRGADAVESELSVSLP